MTNKSSDQAKELSVFHVGDILSALDISEVQEINRNLEITRVPHSPDYVRGVINLRGQIVTVIDLRKKFQFDPVPFSKDMRIVIVKPATESIGLLVDDVEDIVTVNTSELEPPPPHLSGVDGAFFYAVYKMNQGLVSILKLDAVLKSGN